MLFSTKTESWIRTTECGGCIPLFNENFHLLPSVKRLLTAGKGFTFFPFFRGEYSCMLFIFLPKLDEKTHCLEVICVTVIYNERVACTNTLWKKKTLLHPFSNKLLQSKFGRGFPFIDPPPNSERTEIRYNTQFHWKIFCVSTYFIDMLEETHRSVSFEH